MKMENFLPLQRNDFFAIFIHFKHNHKQTHPYICAQRIWQIYIHTNQLFFCLKRLHHSPVPFAGFVDGTVAVSDKISYFFCILLNFAFV